MEKGKTERIRKDMKLNLMGMKWARLSSSSTPFHRKMVDSKNKWISRLILYLCKKDSY